MQVRGEEEDANGEAALGLRQESDENQGHRNAVSFPAPANLVGRKQRIDEEDAQ
jgi:hypothetical protein